MTPEQIRDYEYPGIYKNVDRTPETPAPKGLDTGDLTREECELMNALRFKRHTEDLEPAPPVARPKLRLSGAAWAWVAMSAMVVVYVAWRVWPK